MNLEIISEECMRVYPEKFSSHIQNIQSSIPEHTAKSRQIKSETENSIKEMDELLYKLLLCQLKSVGLFNGDQLESAKIKAGFQKLYDRWLEESLRVLTIKKYLIYNGEYHTINPQWEIEISAVWKEWENKKSQWLKDYNMKAKIMLVESVMKSLPDILKGKIPSTNILFPDSSMDLVEGIYKNNAVADYFNQVLADITVDFVLELCKENPSLRVRILEIGAGTGGTSLVVLKKLAPYSNNIKEYCYTDISKAFLLHAETEYGPVAPFLTYGIFNVEKPLGEQGMEGGVYDVVIATNVLHATRNIRETIRNAKALLQKNGLLLLNEISDNSLFAHLTFGLLEGWWLYEDPELRIPGSPGIYPETWQFALESEGFKHIYFPVKCANDLGQQIIMAESDGIARQKVQVKKDFGKAKAVNPEKRIHKFDTKKPLKEKVIKKNNVITDQMVADHIRTVLRENIGAALRMEEKRIDDNLSFSEYGVDSIITVRLVSTINKALKIELESTNMFDYSSVSQLADFIISSYKDVITEALGGVDSIQEDNQDADNEEKEESIYAKQGYFTIGKTFKEPETKSKNLIQLDPIAVIGMSGRFAKSKNVDELWKHLAEGNDLIEKVSRFDLSKHYSSNQSYCDYGSFLEDIDKFDPLFFNISGLEATYMDPQQRLFLQEAWKALEDAGYAGAEIQGRTCSVYVGCDSGDYNQLIGDNPPAQSFWGNAGSVIPARISYYLDLHGPAIAVDTACSSSLVAIHLACQGLWSRETELALAGGVYIQSTPRFYIVSNRAGMLSPTGHCHAFDEKADGFVPGEGVGVLLLKRLEDALSDGDHIYGVIRGSGINQDGTTNGITAPSANSQERLECQVYNSFNIHPEELQLIEAHGTGTKLGDPIEYQALTKAFRKYTDKKEYCAIGSIKTNLGHAATAAGVAGVIKILLSLKHKQIPPSIHFSTGNSNIKFKDSPFYVNTSLSDWNVAANSKRCAAVSSFGFSGTNAHMVIEEAPKIMQKSSENPGYLIVLSARTYQQLQQQAVQLIHFCEQEEVACGNMSYTLVLGRKHFNYRLACVVQNKNQLIEYLSKWLEKGSSLQVYYSELEENQRREQPSLKRYGNQCIENCDSYQNPGEYMEHLSTIAELYVQGYTLEFEKLFSRERHNRISLPTYPFAEERYWVPENKQIKNQFKGEDEFYSHLLDQVIQDQISIENAVQRTEEYRSL